MADSAESESGLDATSPSRAPTAGGFKPGEECPDCEQYPQPPDNRTNEQCRDEETESDDGPDYPSLPVDVGLEQFHSRDRFPTNSNLLRSAQT